MHCSHHTDLLLFSLNLDFDLFVSTRKYVSPYFWRKFFKLFLFTSAVFFFIECISSHIFCRDLRDLILGFLVGEHKRERYGESNLGANYNSAQSTYKKGASWYRCFSKIGKIPKIFIWNSSEIHRNKRKLNQN